MKSSPTVVGELSDRVGEEYESRSEAVEELLRTAFAADGREREYEERIAELEREIARLNRERRQLLETREEKKELVRYAETQRELDTRREERRDAPVWRRAKWFVFGRKGRVD